MKTWDGRRKRHPAGCIGPAIAIVAVVLGLAIMASQATAHEWYDSWCCNEQDCREAKKGELQYNDKGIVFVPTGKQFVWGDSNLRPSQDGNAHVCLMITGEARCIYYAIAT